MSVLTGAEICMAALVFLLSIGGVIAGRAYSLIYKGDRYPENTCLCQMSGAMIPGILISLYMWNYYYLLAAIVPFILATNG